MNRLSAALEYAGRGWRVFPLHTVKNGDCTCGNPNCQNAGKHPRTEHGYKDSTTSEDVIKQWWFRYPDANIGVATGKDSGVIALDFDVKGGKPGRESYQQFAEECGDVISRTSRTPSGGWHILYQYSGDDIRNRTDILPGLDVRGTGGYIVAPGSATSDGEYRWHNDEPIKPLPEEVRKFLLNGKQKAESTPFDRKFVLDGVPEGQRDEKLFKYACSLQAKGMTQEEAEILVRQAAANCVPPFDEATALEKVRRVYADYPSPEEPKKANVSQATELVGLVDDLPLFYSDDVAYVDLVINHHRETWSLRSKRFRDFLTRKYYLTHQKTPNAQAMEDALRTLSGKALFESSHRDVYTRVGEHGNAIYLDLCADDWSVVEITSEGWRVIKDPPVRFTRRRGTKPLPYPVEGGNVEILFEFLNVDSDDDKKLILGWLVQALRPNGPYPSMIFQGEQGTAKTTAGRVLVELTDPKVAAVRTRPRNEHDLLIAARNSWVVSLDNLSGLSVWISDALCRLATGGGFSTRELFTDTEEILIDVQRPVILNGIDDVATRPDLIDRSIVLTLAPISEEKRKPESVFWREFYQYAGDILGGLLDGVVMALRNESDVSLPQLPRMADFAIWATAAEPAFGYKQGEFLESFNQKRNRAIEAGLEGNNVAVAIHAFMKNQSGWEGTTKVLLQELEGQVEERVLRSKSWPSSPRGLGNELRRLATSFRSVGTNIRQDEERRNDGYHVSIDKDANTCSQRTQRSENEHSEHGNGAFLRSVSERSEYGECENAAFPLDPCPSCGGEGCDWCAQ